MRVFVLVGSMALLAGCGQQGAESPMYQPIDYGVAVGSEISCATPAMQRHCDAWLANARLRLSTFPGAPTGTVASWTIHVGRSTVRRTGEVPAVVVFRFTNGLTVNVPAFCNVYPPGDPGCDLGDVSPPKN
jgi:hypothetical protein